MQSNSNSSQQSHETLTKVSVVMSVYQQPDQVKQTIASVLAQKGVEFEFVIVDDGADNAVKSEINQYKTDSRFVLIEQENQGLTKALINGCDKASNEFIARIDVGDTMLQGRLAQQAQMLAKDSSIGMVTTWVDILTEEGYELYTIDLSKDDLDKGLRSEQSSGFVSPFHSSMMYRKSLYQQVGAYRQEFYFTQDCDLWARMIERSGIGVIEEVLTNGLFSPRGISGYYQPQQSALRDLVTQAISLRKQGKSDATVLKAAEKIRPNNDIKMNSEFDTVYFLAKMLSKKRSKHAKEYWQRALKLKPWSLRVWLFGALNLLQANDKDDNV